MTGHGEVALVSVLVSPSPSMMHAHRIVGSDGTVQERPLRFAAIFPEECFKRLGALPEFQNGSLLSREIDLRFDLLERHYVYLAEDIKKSYSIIEAFFGIRRA